MPFLTCFCLLQLAISSHLGETIRHGPYEGLTKDCSAIEVATAIQEQFNALESIGTGGRLVERELRRRGLYQAGVKTSVADGLRHFTISKKQYEEVLDNTKSTCRRSDLTTTESFRLYSSNFDRHFEMSTADQTFLLARQPDIIPQKAHSVPSRAEKPSNTFLKKASRLGISIIPRTDYISEEIAPLYPSERKHISPEGFEQINDDLFARKDNTFMVFNGAGVDSWKGTHPITKLSHSESIILSTL